MAPDADLVLCLFFPSDSDTDYAPSLSSSWYLLNSLAYLQGYPLERLGETPTGDNPAVSLLEADGDAMRVVFRDDNSHLKTPEFLVGEKVRKRSVALEP